MRLKAWAVALILLVARSARAQPMNHEDHLPQGSTERGMQGHEMMGLDEPLDVPEARNGSGTAWQPDSTPMHAVHVMAGEWMFMFHGLAFAGYDYQAGDRGGQRFISTNWLMAMAHHPLVGGLFTARVMLSLEPLTLGKDGYPLLVQTGETLDGVPLHDRQHPHDLFMEVAAVYSHELGKGLALQVYGAPAGEPALGPVAFPHRLSASADPLAPIGHHWQDSTHISFGVATVGLYARAFKIEGSWFNGREPDENRYNFDFRRFDSFAGRISVNPEANWSLQASYGYLKSPEEHDANESVHRVTASAIYNTPILAQGNWASTFVWGRNFPSESQSSSSFLIESNLDIDKHHLIFGRAEYLRKLGRDLVLAPALDDALFGIGTVALGYLYQLPAIATLLPGIGVRGSANFIGEDLRAYYGTRVPLGFMTFVRVWPEGLGAAKHTM